MKSGQEPPKCADISPDGKLAVSVTEDGEFLVWSLEDGREVVRSRFESPRKTYPHVKFNAANQLVAHIADSNGNTATVTCWDIPSLKMVYELTSFEEKNSLATSNEPTKVRSILAISPNRKYLALDAVHAVRIIDASTGTPLGDLPVSVSRSRLSETADQGLFSSDGKQLFALFQNGQRSSVYVWNLETGQEISSFDVDGSYYVTDWLNSEQVLCTSTGYRRNSVILDVSRHCIVWQLKGNSMPLLSLGNGSFVSMQETNSRLAVPGTRGFRADAARGVMSTKMTFPDAAVVKEIRAKMPAPLPPIAGPSSQMVVGFGQLSGMDALKEKLANAAVKALQEVGMNVGTRDGLSLRLSLETIRSETNLYQVRSYARNEPARDRGTINVTDNVYVFRRDILNQAGQSLWQSDRHLSDSLGLFFRIQTTGNTGVAAAVSATQRTQLEQSLEFVSQEPLPRVFYPQPRFGEDREFGFGSSSLYDSKTFQVSMQEFFDSWSLKSDPRFVSLLQEATTTQQAELAALEPDQLQQTLKWSPALKRPVRGIRCGFGIHLAQTPKENLIKLQGHNFLVMESINGMTGGVGPQLIARLAASGAEGKLGEFPSAADVRISQPVLVGGGNRKQLMDAARAASIDLLVIAHFTGTQTNKSNNVAMTIRLINVDNDQELYATDKITNRTGAGTAADIAGLLVDGVMEFANSKLTLQPLDVVTEADIKDRLAALEKSGSGLPSATAVELIHWKNKGVGSDTQRRAILKKLTSDSTLESRLFSTVGADRSEAIRSLKK